MSLPLQVTSVIIVLRTDRNFLLVQRSLEDKIFPGKWQNVGGKVELGERVEDAIQREVKEEVGFETNETPVFLISFSWKKDEAEPYRLGLIFMVNLKKDITGYKVRLDKELGSHGWFEFEEIKEMNEKNLLIGRTSPTGTFAQIKAASAI